jgi:hypothetical protein
MGKKQSWIKKARGYFDNKPGKLAVRPPEIRTDNVSVLRTLVQNAQSPATPTVTSSGIPDEKPPGPISGVNPGPVSGRPAGQPSVNPSAAPSGRVSGYPFGKPAEKPPRAISGATSGPLSGPLSGQSSVDPPNAPSGMTSGDSAVAGLRHLVSGDTARFWRGDKKPPLKEEAPQQYAARFLEWLLRRYPDIAGLWLPSRDIKDHLLQEFQHECGGWASYVWMARGLPKVMDAKRVSDFVDSDGNRRSMTEYMIPPPSRPRSAATRAPLLAVTRTRPAVPEGVTAPSSSKPRVA